MASSDCEEATKFDSKRKVAKAIGGGEGSLGM